MNSRSANKKVWGATVVPCDPVRRSRLGPPHNDAAMEIISMKDLEPWMWDCLRGGRWRCVQGLAKLPNPSWSHLLVAPWAYPLYVSRECSSPDRQATSVLAFRLYFIIPWHTTCLPPTNQSMPGWVTAGSDCRLPGGLSTFFRQCPFLLSTRLISPVFYSRFTAPILPFHPR